MKNLTILLIFGIIITPIILMGQDEIKRPKNIGVSDFDSFKNTSFDIREESATLSENVGVIDNEIKNYAGIINTIGVEKLKTNTRTKATIHTLRVMANIVRE